jgi:hypothetical protein
VDIDAVQQGAADFSEVLLNLSGRAAALARGIAVEAAFAPVQITTATEYETGVPGGNGPYIALFPAISLPFARRARTLRPRRRPGRVGPPARSRPQCRCQRLPR